MLTLPTETDKLRKLTDLLRDAADPAAIILFGSRARGGGDVSSDYDILVVEREVRDRVSEMVRLRRVLSPLRMEMDLIVVSQAAWRDRSAIPGTYLYHAATEGQVLFGTA